MKVSRGLLSLNQESRDHCATFPSAPPRNIWLVDERQHFTLTVVFNVWYLSGFQAIAQARPGVEFVHVPQEGLVGLQRGPFATGRA